MARVLVTEADRRVRPPELRDAGHEVDVRLGLTPEELLEAVQGAHALIIRSATQVDAATLEAATDLVVVGRAGIGLDNVDVASATELGVMVVNAPLSNILSAAEQTMALLLAQARNIPQAHAALNDRQVGALQVGGRRAARQDPRRHRPGQDRRARRPAGPGLRDAPGRLRPVHLRGARPPHGRRAGRPRRAARAERLHHDPPAQEQGDHQPARTRSRLHEDQARACASSTWRAAASSTRPTWPRRSAAGHVQGAALDVFEKEPTTESPLFELPSVVVVPHLGASTVEAQDKAGVDDRRAGRSWPSPATSCPSPSTSRPARSPTSCGPSWGSPSCSVASSAACSTASPADLEVIYQGELAGAGTKILTLCALKGLLVATGHDGRLVRQRAPDGGRPRPHLGASVSIVESPEYVNLITVRSGAPLGVGHADDDRHARRDPDRHASTATASRSRRRRRCWSCATTTGRA